MTARRRVPLWPFVLAGVVLLGAWIVWSGLRVASAAEHLRTAQDRLQSIDDPLNWALHGDLGVLDSAAADVAAARDDLSSPWLGPWRVAPFVGRQLRASEAMTGSVDRLLTAARPVVRELRQAVDRPTTVDGLPGLVAEVRGVLPPLVAALQQVDLGPRDKLLAPLRSAQDKLAARIDDLRDATTTADSVAAALQGVLTGNRRYLVVAGNNAEGAAGMGAFLSAAVVDVTDGKVHIGPFVNTGNLAITDDRPQDHAPLPPSMAMWSRHILGGDLRTISMTPRFDLVAPFATDIYARMTGTTVDGVLYVDPVLFGEVVAETGPVTFEGRSLGRDEVVAFLLHDQYVDPANPATPVNPQRFLQTAQITATLLQRLFSGDFDKQGMARALQRGADGRHLMLWSRDATQQQAWERLGVAGTLRPESLAVTLDNRGANKLDWFVDVGVDVAARRVGEGLSLHVTLTATNRAPTGEPVYVAGPTVPGPVAGRYVGYATFHAPVGCRFDAVGGTVVARGTEVDREAAASLLVADRGQVVTATADLTCPRPWVELRLEPSARPRPVRWTVAGLAATDERPRWLVVGDAPAATVVPG